MKHLHHIIPKYMGGTDDPDNLIELTVAEHAEAHRKLYEKHGNKEDYLAWKGLSGEIGKEQIVHEMRKSGASQWANSEKNHWKNPEWQKKKNPRLNLEYQRKVQKLANSPEAIAKKKKTMAERKHQQGEKNTMYGKRWIHSLTEKRSTRIDKNDPLPEGWLEGRKMKFVDA